MGSPRGSDAAAFLNQMNQILTNRAPIASSPKEDSAGNKNNQDPSLSKSPKIIYHSQTPAQQEPTAANGQVVVNIETRPQVDQKDAAKTIPTQADQKDTAKRRRVPRHFTFSPEHIARSCRSELRCCMTREQIEELKAKRAREAQLFQAQLERVQAQLQKAQEMQQPENQVAQQQSQPNQAHSPK